MGIRYEVWHTWYHDEGPLLFTSFFQDCNSLSMTVRAAYKDHLGLALWSKQVDGCLQD
jgi:hypothetical protein